MRALRSLILLLLSFLPSPSRSSSWKAAWKGPVFVLFPGLGLKSSDYDAFLSGYEVACGPEELFPLTKDGVDRMGPPGTPAFDRWFAETKATYDQLLDDLEDVPVIMFGHSAGIMMATACALKQRKNIAALVTFGGAPWAENRDNLPCPTLALCGTEDGIALSRFQAVAEKVPPPRSGRRRSSTLSTLPVEYSLVQGADHYAVVSEEGARRSIALNAAIRGEEDAQPDESVSSLRRSSSEAQRHMDDIHAKIIAFLGRLSYSGGNDDGGVGFALGFGTLLDVLSSWF
jgi:hypothetical protein